MKTPSNAYAFAVLCLQAADEGRGDVLFGESLARVQDSVAPFMLPGKFPGVYLEFPLIGDPFLDVTVLYQEIDSGLRIDSAAAEGTGAVLDWYAAARKEHEEISFGFELDTKEPQLPMAAIHFQPRSHIELVEPFCRTIGEPDRAKLYFDTNQRLPESWSLSFFGMFRGRPRSPLRVCGYLDCDEVAACAADPKRLRDVFEAVGFTAFDDAMIEQARAALGASPGNEIDFQFDVYPDGSLGDTFAFDIRFGIKQPEEVIESFENGVAGRAMRLLEDWGLADERWHLAPEASFARAIPVEREDGSMGRYSFTLLPQWVKVRWKNGVLTPSKLYFLGSAGFLDDFTSN